MHADIHPWGHGYIEIFIKFPPDVYVQWILFPPDGCVQKNVFAIDGCVFKDFTTAVSN